MVVRKTPVYKLRYFDYGDTYEYQADHERFQAIENQLDAALSLTRGGIIRGWNVQAGSGFSLTISSGIGVVPFLVDQILIDKTHSALNKVYTQDKSLHYLSVKTSQDLIVPQIGKNRKTVIYIGLNQDTVGKILSDPQKRNNLIDFTSTGSVNVYVYPSADEPPGTKGPYRDTQAQETKYPITNYEILGDFNENENDLTVFINGKAYYENYSHLGKIITFNYPLQPEDIVSVRVEPKFSLAIAEVETNETGIVGINNTIKTNIYELIMDSQVHKDLIEHVHSAATNQASKILLTTKTGFLSYSSKVGNRVYYFQKPTASGIYAFDFGIDQQTGLYNYLTEIYVNGKINTDEVETVDDGVNIKISFPDSLEDNDIVQIVLLVKDYFTQIENKIDINTINPAQEKIDISISAEKITSGLLSSERIPKLSHDSISRQALRPTNSVDEEYVHRIETRDYREFSPVLNKKSNARNAKFLFTEPQNLDARRYFYACAGGTLLFAQEKESDLVAEDGLYRSGLMGDDIGNFFSGWNIIDFERNLSNGNLNFGEFDAPFRIVPIKHSSSDDNYDELWVVSEKFIYSLKIVANKFKIEEIANLTGDFVRVQSNLSSLTSSIIDAQAGNGILNLSRTIFTLGRGSDDRVYFSDLVNSKFNWWDITSTPLWNSATSLTVLDPNNEEDLDVNLVFVGATTSSSFDLYANALGYSKISRTLNTSNNEGVFIGGISEEPSLVFDDVRPLFSINDEVILSTYGAGEKNTISALDENNLLLNSSVSKTYQGLQNGKYSSIILKEWKKLFSGFDSNVRRVLFKDKLLHILTENNVYVYKTGFDTINDVVYFINELSATVEVNETNFTIIESTSVNDFSSAQKIIIAGENGVQTFENGSLTEAQNVGYAQSLNDLLFSSNFVCYDRFNSKENKPVYLCGRYGIFQSYDGGDSWRNTVQILGQPIDPASSYIFPKDRLRILIIDEQESRIYVAREQGMYAYGYGYGAGTGIDYFDVLANENGSYGYGYGINSFELEYPNAYGYGFGFELISVVSDAGADDWIYFDNNSGGTYRDKPLKIISKGVENNLFYYQVEQPDGDVVDFSQFSENSVILVYEKTNVIPLIDGQPQSVLYDVQNAESFVVDYSKQSVIFDSQIDPDKTVQIASKFKIFEPLEEFDTSLISSSNSKVFFNGFLVENWVKNSDNKIIFPEFIDGYDILRITTRGIIITDVGESEHHEIEDYFSLEETGLEFHFDGVRNANIMTFIMSVRNNLDTLGITSEPFENLIGIQTSKYDDDFVDIDDTFIENSILLQNNNLGQGSDISSYVFYDSQEDKFFVGSNTGIWRRDSDKNIYSLTGSLLSTIDATGSVSVPLNLNGAVIQYNKTSEEWTVTWGGGMSLKDNNLGLNETAINTIAICPDDTNFIVIGTNDTIYRSFDSGVSWECVLNAKVNSLLQDAAQVKRIVFDDKHPWIVNAVFDKKLMRSVDRGNNWEEITGSDINFSGVNGFSYQIDSTDIRSTYYYGKNAIYFETWNANSPFVFLNKEHNSSRKFSTFDIFGLDYNDADINKIINDQTDVNNVYLSVGNYGVYKTNLLGENIPNLLDVYPNGTYGWVIGAGTLNDAISNGSNKKVAALSDILNETEGIPTEYIPYCVYVDGINKRTFVQVLFNATKLEIPQDGEFIGKYVRVKDSDKNSMKVLANYDRGPNKYWQQIYDVKENYLEHRRIEFVLDGEYPKLYDKNTGEALFEINGDDYYYSSIHAPSFIRFSILTEMNGGRGNIKLADISERIYAVKLDTFNSYSLNETVFIIRDAPLSFKGVDTLADYYIGEDIFGFKFRIYESENYGATDVACRMEQVDEDGNGGFDFASDPYNLWFRYSFSDLHNITNVVSLYNSSNVVVNSLSDVLTTVLTTNQFITDIYQNCAILSWPVGDCPAGYQVADALDGLFLGNITTNNRYEIYGSKFIAIGNELYDATKDQVLVQLDVYSSSYYDDCVLLSDGSISSYGENYIVLANSLGLVNDALQGYSLYFDDKYWRVFEITSNTGGKIYVQSSGLSNILSTSNLANCRYDIFTNSTRDLIFDTNFYAAALDGFYISVDKKTWAKKNSGLVADSITNEPYVKFNLLQKYGGYIYASSNTLGYSGLYKFNITSESWSRILGNSDDIFYQLGIISFKVIDKSGIDYIYLGTEENGFYIPDENDPENSWVKVELPENIIDAIDLVSNHDSLSDLDRIWVGTQKGILVKDKQDELWTDFSSTNSSYIEIAAGKWTVWNFDLNDDGEISASSISRISSGTVRNWIEKEYAQETPTGLESIFDWVYSETITGYNNKTLMLWMDAFNSSYFTREISSTITSQASRGAHCFDNFTNSIVGNENIYTQSQPGFKKITFDKIGLYEQPFKHFPDMSSIFVIGESSNKVILGTDRNGLWRAKSKNQFILPSPSADYTNNFGYVFNSANLTVAIPYTTAGYRLFDGEKINNLRWIVDNRFYYDVQQSLANSGYDDIDALDDYNDLLGSYVVVAKSVSETTGAADYFVFGVYSIEKFTGYYRLELSVGQVSLENTTAAASIFSRFDSASKPNSDYIRMFIVDFQVYERINNGLPVMSIKDSQGEYEIAAFIKDISISGVVAYAACGLAGIYSTSNIEAVSVSWVKENISEYDFTSIIYVSANEIYAGTWGNGVWAKINGTWSELGEIEHRYVWSLFRATSGTLFAGTEHGGIYRYGSSWARIIDNFTRSQIDCWKVEGIYYAQENYAHSDKLIAYAWGAGIMRSLDCGITWEQAITGLSNLYIQDVALSGNVAYAATFGGGVFKSGNIWAATPTWVRCSVENLPNTLNIDQIETGMDSGIIYINARENDFSLKDVPFRYRYLAGKKLDPKIFDHEDRTSEFDFGNWRQNGYYLPITTFVFGERKCSVFRSENSGSSWASVYDKQSGSNYSNSISGLSIVPNESDFVKFIDSYYQDGVEHLNLVSIESGLISGEIEIPNNLDINDSQWGGIGSRNSTGELFLSINPINTDQIFLSFFSAEEKDEIVLLRSDDNGLTWAHSISWANPKLTRFSSRVQFSTTENNYEELTLENDSQVRTLSGTIDDEDFPSYYWNSAGDYFEIDANVNYFVTARFDDSGNDSNLFFMSDRPRPFYFVGAVLTPDITRTDTYTVSDGGNSDYLPGNSLENREKTTLIIDSSYDKSVRNLTSTNVELSNLVSLEFDYTTLSANSLLAQENVLVGCDIGFDEDYSTRYKIALHRIYGTVVELIVIGDIDVSTGSNIRIYPSKTIYSLMNDGVWSSVNGGLTWTSIGSSSFVDPSNKLIAAENISINEISDSTVERRTLAIIEQGGDYYLYRGDAQDDRYDTGKIVNINWTKDIDSDAIDNVLQDGLVIASLAGGVQYVYISETNKVKRAKYINGVYSSISEVFNLTIAGEIVNIQHPVFVYQEDQSRAGFISNEKIYLTSNSFDTISYAALSGFNGKNVKKLEFSGNNTILACVDQGQKKENYRVQVQNVYGDGIVNKVGASAVSSLLLKNATEWVGVDAFFEIDNVPSEYIAKIKSITNLNIEFIESVYGYSNSIIYDPILEQTVISCSVNDGIINDNEESFYYFANYIGNIVAFSKAKNGELFYSAKIKNLYFADNVLKIYIPGDIRQIISDNGISSLLYFRIGDLPDYLQSSFTGYLITSKDEDKSQNGLWQSLTAGASWTKITNDVPNFSCDEIKLHSSFKNIVVHDNNSVKIMVNDKWFASEDIQDLAMDEDENIFLATSNGLSTINRNGIDINNIDFDSEMQVGLKNIQIFGSDTIVVDVNSNVYFNGISADLQISSLRKAIKDKNDIIWLATDNGLLAFFDENKFVFNTTNSDILSNDVRDIHQDSFERIWICLGPDGIMSIDYSLVNNLIENLSFFAYAESDGFNGSIDKIIEKNGLSVESDGTISTPVIKIHWSNDSLNYSSSVVLRSQNEIVGNISAQEYSFNPVSGSIATVIGEVVDSINYWKISLSGLSYLSSFDDNSLNGKFIYVNSRVDSDLREIVFNTGNDIYILQSSGDVPVANNRIFIVEIIEDFQADIMYVGDGQDIAFSLEDIEVVNDSAYYYHLYFFDPEDSVLKYNFIDNATISVSSNAAYPVSSDSVLLFVGINGIYKYTGNVNKLFEIITIYNDIQLVNDAIIDLNSNVWISADDKLVKFSSFKENYGISELFSGHSAIIAQGGLEVRKVVEDAQGNLFVATNYGLVVLVIDGRIIQFIANDEKRLAKDIWRTAFELNEKYYRSQFVDSNDGVYLRLNDKIYFSGNQGLSWVEIIDGFNSDYLLCAKNKDNSAIVDYVWMQSDGIGSYFGDTIGQSVRENLMVLEQLANIDLAGNIYLSENGTNSGKILFAGLINNQISSQEREIAKISFPASQIVGNVSYIYPSSGLSIQSIYCFSELIDGGTTTIFAGGKGNVSSSTDDGLTWGIVPFDSQSLEDDEFVYTSLATRLNEAGFEHSSNLLYATRTKLYGGDNSSIVSIRLDSLTNRVQEIDLGVGIVNSQSDNHILPSVDRSPFANYDAQIFPQGMPFLNGHCGAIKFLDSCKTLIVGGFDNSLFIVPFTTEENDNNPKSGISIISRRGKFANNSFPVYDRQVLVEQVIDFEDISYGRSNPLLADQYIRPRQSWAIGFNSNDDQIGYLASTILADNSFYTYGLTTNISYIHTTRDGGMIWQPFVKTGYPNSVIANMIIDENDFIISGFMGTGLENVGIYRYLLGQWVQDSGASIPTVPVGMLKKEGYEVYAGPLGNGIYKIISIVQGYGYGYGGELTLDYFDVLGQEGEYVGYAYDYDDSFYGYAQGFEETYSWVKYSSRFVTQDGFNFGAWKIKAIEEDPNNKNRVIVGTDGQGIIEGEYKSGAWEWKFDINGLPSGNVSALKVLNSNSNVIFVGIVDSENSDNNGLYIKDPDLGYYWPIPLTELPAGTVNDIKIDTNIENIFTTINFENNNHNIIILRSVFEIPRQTPENVTYYVGNEIFNSEVVYVGNESGLNGLFVDRDKTLKPGLPYFYRIYRLTDSGYVEKETITGMSSSVAKLSITTSTDVFGNEDYSGRVVKVRNSLNNLYYYFEIESNTANNLVLKPDSFNIINKGDATLLNAQRLEYTILSVYLSKSILINPMYCVINGVVYYSENGGYDWALYSTGINALVNKISISPHSEKYLTISTLWAAAIDGVFRSIDSGVNWTRISKNILAGDYNGLLDGIEYQNILIDNQDSLIVYALAQNGYIYRTINGGNDWDNVELTSNEINFSDIITYSTNYIYLSVDGLGFYRVEDCLRDKFFVNIETDGKFTDFNVRYLEMGDKYTTDSNSIQAQTYVKNDSLNDTREELIFKLNDDAEYINFEFIKENDFIPHNDISICGTSSYSNPFALENSKANQIDLMVNKIGRLDNDNIYAITNKGVYLSEIGDKWNKLNSALIPELIMDINVLNDKELFLASENKGLWISKEDRTIFKYVEQNGSTVNTVWETNINGERKIFRAGTNGLYITVEKPTSKSIVVFSGPSFGSSPEIKFSTGSLTEEYDGAWSAATRDYLDTVIYASDGETTKAYKGWDRALIVRKGPFLTLENAQTSALNNDIFIPSNNVIYPSVLINDDEYTFRKTSDTPNLEEIRDQNLAGNESISTLVPSIGFMSGGNIIVGRFKNLVNDNYPTSNNHPTTDKLIVDKIRALTGADRILSGTGRNSGINYADKYAYIDETQASSTWDTQFDLISETSLAPDLLANRYYIYRIYPYRMIPAHDVFVSSQATRPLFPKYLPMAGDLVDSYSYVIDINKFYGATTILNSTTFSDGNWIIGTDVGPFFSTESGMNVKRTTFEALYYEVLALFCSISDLLIVVVNGNDGIDVYQNAVDIHSEDFDTSWVIMAELKDILLRSGVNKIFNFAQDGNRNIFISTSKGIFEGDANGENWKRSNSVGDLESLANKTIIGQQFSI